MKTILLFCHVSDTAQTAATTIAILALLRRLPNVGQMEKLLLQTFNDCGSSVLRILNVDLLSSHINVDVEIYSRYYPFVIDRLRSVVILMLMRFRSTDYSGKLQRVELYTSSSDRSAVDEEILVLCDKVHEPVGVEVGVKVGVADHATTTLNAISISTSAVPQSNSPHHDLLLQTHKRSIFSHVIGPLLHASELAAIMHDESKGGSDTGSKQVLGGLVIHGLSGSGKSSLALAIGASMVGGGVKTIVCNCNELIKKEMGGSERSVR